MIPAPPCPKCNRSDRVVETDAKTWLCCMRCQYPYRQGESQRAQELRRQEERARERLKGNR